MQILKLFYWFQPITDDHTRHCDDVISDVVQMPTVNSANMANKAYR